MGGRWCIGRSTAGRCSGRRSEPAGGSYTPGLQSLSHAPPPPPDRDIFLQIFDVDTMKTSGSMSSLLTNKKLDVIKEETIKSGLISEKDYQKIVDPKKMLSPD